MTTGSFTLRLVCLLVLCHASPLLAQVDYGKDNPWNQRAESGPDAEVPGWFYNLGITGLRAQLVADEPKALLIKYVFPKSPADGRVKVGDLIVGAGGQMFQEAHRNGYGEKVFGADGPIAELARVLEECQGVDRKGKLALTLRRGQETVDVELDVGREYGTYSAAYPGACAKSDKILAKLLKYLVAHQEKDGSFGDPVHNTFAPLALLASGDAKYLPAVERNVRYHCRVTRAKDLSLINWSYTSAAIVLSEYYLATGDKWVLPELQKVHDLLAKSQYLRMSQIDPRAKKSHPDSFPKGPKDSHGGWGHNPGFEGYGPIAMLTGQGALAYSLMHRCGIKIDRRNHDAAYEFLKRGTGKNGYVWYGDQIGGGPDNWADMGRTGAAGIANFLSPYDDPVYRERALSHAKVIGKHPQSFPDTHGSPAMGMAYTALAANVDPDSFRKLMDANRWWFTMAQCIDGSFYYQPNRDNAGYGADARMTASSVVAFLFTIPKHSLVITGKEAAQPRAKPAKTPPAVENLLAGRFQWKATPPLLAPLDRPDDSFYSVKDPSVVFHNGRWHVFCTIRGQKRSHQIEYFSLVDWSEPAKAKREILKLSDEYFCAPQVFYFTPHKQWYMILQVVDKSRKPALQPAYATSENIADPAVWSKPKLLYDKPAEGVSAWIDFWVICDEKKAHLFFTTLNGQMWRAETALADFPGGWSKPAVVLRGDIFEASHTYRLKGLDKYLTLVEAQAAGRRYYKAYLADRLDGQWKPLADTLQEAFAAPGNVRFDGKPWTDSFSHGELLRIEIDEKLEVDPARLRFLYQGVSDPAKQGKPYGQIPWQLGLLETVQ
jgi:hypothetical protein